MRIQKNIILIVLATAIILAFYILTKTICLKEWNTVSSSLAVITAIIASWSAQRVIWKQEDELEPNLEIILDIDSRKGAAQLLVQNTGGSTAYNIIIHWTKPVKDFKGKVIHFNSGEKGIDFRRLGKGQKYWHYVGTTADLFKKSKDANELLEFEGYIEYRRSKKSKFKKSEKFFISLEPYRDSLDSNNDYNNFLSEVAKIHEDLRNINETLKIKNTSNNNLQ